MYVAAALMIVSMLSPPVSAAVYVCKNSDGARHFTNIPMSDSCVVFKRKKTSPFSSVRSSRRNLKTSKVVYGNGRLYDSHINHFGKRYRIDPNLIKAVIRTESDFNHLAVSRMGAQGLMQLMPDTARELKVEDPFNPGQNIEGGTRYLRYLLDTFDGDVTLSLAAYNAGPTIVKKVRRVPRIPETVAYVERVLTYYNGYSKRGHIADVFQGSTIRVSDVVTVQ